MRSALSHIRPPKPTDSLMRTTLEDHVDHLNESIIRSRTTTMYEYVIHRKLVNPVEKVYVKGLCVRT